MGSYLTIFAFLLIGLLTGISTGLTGSSGVVLVVPLLSLLMGYSIYAAIGTSLLVDVLASALIAGTYFRHGNVDMGAASGLVIGAVIGAQVGAHFATRLPESGFSIAFGLGMVLVGALVYQTKGSGGVRLAGLDGNARVVPEPALLAQTVLIGSGVGLATGLSGAGGGMVILFVLLFILKLPMHRAIGTSTLVMAVTAASGAVGYLLNGHMALGNGLIVGAGAVTGGILSARLANHFSEQRLARLAAATFVLVGLCMTAINLVTR